MKKLLVLVTGLLLSSAVMAQKGTFYVGGGLGFNSGDANTALNLAPEVGTWLSDDIQVGGVLQFATNSDTDPKSKMGLIAYGRKWTKIDDKFSLYYGIFADFHTGSNQDNSDHNGFGIHADAGFAYSLSAKWGIVGRAATLGFSSMNDDSSFGLNVANTPVFNLGIYYTL